MYSNELRRNEEKVRRLKLKAEKDKWKEEDKWKRIICIFNVCQELKKPNNLNVVE